MLALGIASIIISVMFLVIVGFTLKHIANNKEFHEMLQDRKEFDEDILKAWLNDLNNK